MFCGRIPNDACVATQPNPSRGNSHTHIVWGEKRPESWKHWEANVCEARFSAGLRAAGRVGQKEGLVRLFKETRSSEVLRRDCRRGPGGVILVRLA